MDDVSDTALAEDAGRAGVEKSPDAFRTISEVSTALDVPQHVLRFWEGKFAQIRPLKRGGGRRYYRPDDVDLLRGIQSLLYGDGYTIKGVQKLLRENGAKFVIAAGRRRAEPSRGKAPAARSEPVAPRAEAPHVAASSTLPESEPSAAAAPPQVAEAVRPSPPPPPEAPSPESAPEFTDAPLDPVPAATPEVIEVVPGMPSPVVTPTPEPQPPTPAVPKREAAARLLSHLKAMRREYDLALQAAKNGRVR